MTTSTQNERLTTYKADPWTQDGYSNWKPSREAALNVRRQWMQMMGVPQDEIDEYCAEDQPADFDEEMAEYNSMVRVEEVNRRIRDKK